MNLNIERIVAQGSELLVGEFKNSPDLSIGGRVNLEHLNDRTRLCGRAVVNVGTCRCGAHACEIASHLQLLVSECQKHFAFAKNFINCLRVVGMGDRRARKTS